MTYPKTSSFGPAAVPTSTPASAGALPGASGRVGPVVPSPRFPDIERETLAFWEHDDTFRASIAKVAESRCGLGFSRPAVSCLAAVSAG